MSPDEIDNIFTPFWRADATSCERASVRGNGVGLSICKKICQQLGGDITVDSKIGKGTKMTATMMSYLVDKSN